ncbi:oligopeptide ABC transporter permease [Clostridium sp. Marseille-Q2269]|uniref:oligopeptide ABC transporter permease n=1 Tax=Clostridium sp. Marseille-Q2269 TaxID=2942205 RepID=UPI002073EAA8|nr:oligopeptide ABC transporter permease [Clostridium sp. Marseille-Q2269]
MNLKYKRKNTLTILALIIIVSLIIISILAPYITKYKLDASDLYNIYAGPSREHILGTDEVGRDVFTRLIYGGRVSLMVGFSAMIVQLTLGIILGAVSGYMGGVVDKIIMGIVDIILCFPFYVIAITIAAIVGPSIWNLIGIIGVLSWPEIARIIRSEIMSLKENDYVMAARSMGLNSMEIIFHHLLPNVITPIIVAATLAIAQGILSEAALSFLGMGVRPPMPSWGNMLSSAQDLATLQRQWWMWIPAGIMVIIIVISINLLGDGIKEHMNSRNKRK